MAVPAAAFAICGHSGAGKTTLIEQLLPLLQKKGLKVAVLKHDAHHIDLDKPGKDSYRFFQAGADVMLQNSDEGFFRTRAGGKGDFNAAVRVLAEQCDLILVEGYKHTPLPKVWLLSEGEISPQEGVNNIVAVLSRDCNRPQIVFTIIENFLNNHLKATPVWGCVLMGGSSVRMGRPKHLLVNNGSTWLERTVSMMQSVCPQVVMVGKGEIPGTLRNLSCLTDIPSACGPIAGLLAAMRWMPHVSWLVSACDLPYLSVEALQWLLYLRKLGNWALLPMLPNSEYPEPLLAYYDFRCRLLLENQILQSNFRLCDIVHHPKAYTPVIPTHLISVWENINTPDDLCRIK